MWWDFTVSKGPFEGKTGSSPCQTFRSETLPCSCSQWSAGEGISQLSHSNAIKHVDACHVFICGLSNVNMYVFSQPLPSSQLMLLSGSTPCLSPSWLEVPSNGKWCGYITCGIPKRFEMCCWENNFHNSPNHERPKPPSQLPCQELLALLLPLPGQRNVGWPNLRPMALGFWWWELALRSV